MSTRSSLKEQFGPRVQVQDVVRVASGSRARFLLKSKPRKVKGPQAALALIRRHVPLRQAHSVVTRLFDDGEAIVEVPKVENAAALARDLAKCNIIAKLLKSQIATTGR
jgi:hypothetical protein